jgi:hypothetical protein
LTHRVGGAPVEGGGATHRMGAPAPMRCTRARSAGGQVRGPSRVITPGSVCPGAHTASTDDVIDPVPWTLLTSPKRDFGDGGGSSDRGAPTASRCRAICTARRMVGGKVRSQHTNPLTTSRGAHANVHRRHVCLQDRESFFICYHGDGSCFGAGGAFDSLSGCPK